MTAQAVALDTAPPGARVAVWNSFLSRWTTGFEVDDVCPGGVRVRRVSDSSVLPVLIPGQLVRDDQSPAARP
jgi:hypothetical protein